MRYAITLAFLVAMVPNALQLVDLTNTCDVPDKRRSLLLSRHVTKKIARDADDAAEDATEKDCICNNTTFDVLTVAGECQTCLTTNGSTDDDVQEIQTLCAATTTTPTTGTAKRVARRVL
ncbi:uncharacterized protein BCR38DRAFT_486868 [Pseudomassariella vexata]|uniref:Uncharacterized protein n=1 Tax=Pseudomassariella vexata TaxID=1141098 RepID=A0A1Y2DTJ3_9PEZI|nr:uncharacterized protein BCR38DRAFT_486868 [Pseudomassariella vexata]ORY62602.1 hypothetical protein BCR38DRAFT_486868 [Pseudomassariella vexata]